MPKYLKSDRASYRASARRYRDRYQDNDAALLGASGARIKYTISLRAAGQNGSFKRENPLVARQNTTNSETNKSLTNLAENSISALILEIIQTRSSIEDDGKDRVNLTTTRARVSTSPEQDGDSENETPRWIHLVADPMSLDEFEALAIDSANLSKDEIGLVLRLMKRVRQKSVSFLGSRSLEPVVLSFVGQDPATQEDSEKRAIFLSLPYFLLKELKKPNINAGSNVFPTRALLQTGLRLQSTYDRDKQQVARKLSRERDCKVLQRNDDAIYVPQLWAILIDNKSLVTYATEGLEILFGTSIINLTKPKRTKDQAKARKISLKTNDDRTFEFPASNCESWFELLSTLESTFPGILSDYTKEDEHNPMFQLTKLDGTIIDRKNWHKIVEAERSQLIEVLLFIDDYSGSEHDSETFLSSPYAGVARGGSSFNQYKEAHTFHRTSRPGSRMSSPYLDPYSSKERLGAYSQESDSVQENSYSFPLPVRLDGNTARAPRRDGSPGPKKHNRYHSPHPMIYDSPELAPADNSGEDQDVEQLVERVRLPPSKKEVRFRTSNESIRRPGTPDRIFAKRNSGHRDKYRSDNFESRKTRSRQGTRHSGFFVGPQVDAGPLYYEPKGKVSTKSQPAVEIVSLEPSRPSQTDEPEDLPPASLRPDSQSPKEPQRNRRSRESQSILETLSEKTPLIQVGGYRVPIFCWPVHENKSDPSSNNDMATEPTDPGAKKSTEPGSEKARVDGKVDIEDNASKLGEHHDETHDNSNQIREDEVSRLVEPSTGSVKDASSTLTQENAGDSSTAKKTLIKVDLDVLTTILGDIEERVEAGLPPSSAEFYAGISTSTIYLTQNALNHLEGRLSKQSSKLSQGPSEKIQDSASERGVDTDSEFKLQDSQQEDLEDKRRIFAAARKIFAAFLPRNFRHKVADKFWGALERILSVQGPGHIYKWPSLDPKIDRFLKTTPTAYLADALEVILKSLKSILQGVEFGGETHYQIPIGIIDVFTRIMLFLVIFDQSFSDKDAESFQYEFFLEAVSSTHHGCTVLDILATLKETERQLIRMLYTQDYDVQVNYESIQLNALLGLVLNNLVGTSLRQQNQDIHNLEEMYNEYTSILEAKVSRKATASVFNEIRLLSDELDIVGKTLDKQKMAVLDYYQLVFDREFEGSRYLHYPQYSDEMLARVLGDVCLSLDVTQDEFDELQRHVRDVQLLAGTTIQIQTELQDYAILIFTIVTVIFLPMSFVTSYLGMNTIDIRDMAWSQSLFWIISMPIVAVTLATVFWLLKPEKLRYALKQFFNKDD